jgi:hypothetical protein
MRFFKLNFYGQVLMLGLLAACRDHQSATDGVDDASQTPENVVSGKQTVAAGGPSNAGGGKWEASGRNCEKPTELPSGISVRSQRGHADRTYSVTGADAKHGVTFHWLFEDGWQIVSGQGASSVAVKVPSHTKVYSVKVAYTNDCGTGPYRDSDARGIEPDVISTADALIAMMTDSSAATKNWTLGVDIDLDNFEWTPVGTIEKPFSGVFDGMGHTISNFKINGSASDGLGFIGVLHDNNDPDKAIIRNLNVVSVEINESLAENENTSQNAGALVGKAVGGLIESVSASNVTVKCAANCGGLVGYSSARILKSSSSGAVTAFSHTAGGLVGDSRGLIHESFSEVVVAAAGLGGGLVGLLYPDSSRYQAAEIFNSYAKGSVTQLGTQTPIEFGGLAGRADLASIRSSFATGDVAASVTTSDWSGGVGGFVGRMLHGLVDNSFSSGNVRGHSNVGGFVGLTTNYSDGHAIVDSNSETIAKTLIRSSWSSSAVEGVGSCGGFVGRNRAWITKSYAVGSVLCKEQAGGFVGLAYGENTSNKRSDITDSYSTASVNATNAQAGSFAGRADAALFTRVFATGTVTGGSDNDPSVLVFDGMKVYGGGAPARLPQLGGFFGSVCCTVNFDNAFWDTNTTGLSNFADFWEWNGTPPAVVPVGKTTQELKDATTFSSWDKTTIWEVKADFYPVLRLDQFAPEVWAKLEDGSYELKWNQKQ